MDNAENDKRVDVIDMPDPLPGANCYMVVPGNTLTFNPYASPGEYITATKWMSYETRMGTKENPKITRIGLIWQTTPGLIKELYNLTSNGEIRLVTDNESGNALIAAYDDSNNILWSWHIWVTDYVLDNVSDNMSDNSAAVTTGGNVYKWNGSIWMDRGIGATTAEIGKTSSFGMIYQWGRKDPFLPGNEMVIGKDIYPQNSAFPAYDANGNEVYFSGAVVTSSNDFNRVMQNPLIFYNTTTGNLWYGNSKVTDLWSTTKKTFFDPCPAGWKIPPTSAMNFGSSSIRIIYTANSNQIATNRTECIVSGLTGLFWLCAGYRDIRGGYAGGTGHVGVYWNADCASSYGMLGSAFEKRGNGRAQSDTSLGRCIKYTP